MKIILSPKMKTSLAMKDKFSFCVVVRTDSTSEYTPGRNVKNRMAHPLSVDVIHQVLKLVSIGPLVQLFKRLADVVCRQEW